MSIFQAVRHGAKLTGKATFKVVDGRNQRGSQGARLCVVAEAPALPAPKRRYGWMTTP